MGRVRSWRNDRAWIDTIAEGADDSEQFVVTPSWICRCLKHDVRGLVDRVASSVERVIQTSPGPGRIHEEVLRSRTRCRRKRREPSPADGCLRPFHGNADRVFATEILDNAEAVPPRVSEAHRVVHVDRHRQNLLAVLDALPGLRSQRPHLPACKLPAVIKCRLSPQLALAEHVAIGLPVVGGRARAEEVRLVVGAYFGGSNLCLAEQADSGLTTREVVFGNFT